MVTIEIVKKGWFGKKYHARIRHQNGNILFWSQKQYNLSDLEEMIAHLKKSLPKADIVYK